MKICTKCNVKKNLFDFSKNGYSAYGDQRYRSNCKQCDLDRRPPAEIQREYVAKSRKKDVERARLIGRRTYQKKVGLPVEPLETKAPKFKGVEHYKNYRALNKEYLDAKAKEWDLAHPENLRAKKARRRAKEKKAQPLWANEFFIEEAYHLATLREKITNYKWEVDHIIPLQGKNVCGLHVETNLQVVPKKYNREKSNIHSKRLPFGILL